jgi:hypothetical protein
MNPILSWICCIEKTAEMASEAGTRLTSAWWPAPLGDRSGVDQDTAAAKGLRHDLI